MTAIEWHTVRGYALDSAQSEKKPILLDYYNPQWIGCQQMDAVTYPREEVIGFVNNYLVPLRINVKVNTPHEHLRHLWTPTIAVLNLTGEEMQRTVGFMEPEEFIANMHLAIAKVRLDGGKYDTAMIHLKSLLESFPGSAEVPEAIYFSGVVMYKESNNPGKLKEAYEQLSRDYPNSPWTKRAYPYRLI